MIYRKYIQKRGLSTVVTTIIMVLLVIVLISVVWVVINNLISSESEVAEARSKFFSERVDIKSVNVNNLDVSFSLTKVGGEIILDEVEVIQGTLDVDLISVVDLSGSMFTCLVSDCTCAGASVTQTCCESLGIAWDAGSGTCHSAWPGLDDPLNSCTNICGGKWDYPVEGEKDANKLLINTILGQPGESRIGLKAYGFFVVSSRSSDLTQDALALNAIIDSWTDSSGTTCTCCGINGATDSFLSLGDDESKIMIVMSDGAANSQCAQQGITLDLNGDGIADDGGDDAIKAACDANGTLSNLTIHAIGLGLDELTASIAIVARNTLGNISKCGGGIYYNAADAGQLAAAYQAIADSVTQTFTSTTKFNFLRVIFYGSPGSVTRDVEVPNILEIKNYDFQLSSVDLTGPIIKIEIYPIIITDSGKEIAGPLLDSWKV